MVKILIVEDEKPICDLININLTSAGYRCFCANDGFEAITKIDSETFDLILLDIMLPKINGYELMEYIKPLEIPVIFVTAKHEIKDRVKGLKLGADDYLVKPFDVIELLARVESVLRRYNKTNKKFLLKGVAIDLEARTVTKNGKIINLTMKEFGLLVLFVRNKNIALFKNVLYEKVWEDEYDFDSKTLDLHVQRLRKKLGWEKCLLVVYKVGYRLEV